MMGVEWQSLLKMFNEWALEEYGQRSFRKVFANYFDNSVENLLSFMAKEENLTEEEIEKLKSLINSR
jgi:predicted transcriptional regulator